jgi:tRNA 2-thiouridine synthesizing protein E
VFDEEGFLQELGQWSPQIAEEIALRESITMNEEHWEIIHLLRDYYQQYEASPAMRALVKFVKLKLGPDKGRSLYLLQLFPGSPAKLGSKIAGLPKPDNCL